MVQKLLSDPDIDTYLRDELDCTVITVNGVGDTTTNEAGEGAEDTAPPDPKTALATDRSRPVERRDSSRRPRSRRALLRLSHSSLRTSPPATSYRRSYSMTVATRSAISSPNSCSTR